MKEKTKQAGPAAWLRENKWTCAVLAAALVLLIVGRLLAAPAGWKPASRRSGRTMNPPW